MRSILAAVAVLPLLLEVAPVSVEVQELDLDAPADIPAVDGVRTLDLSDFAPGETALLTDDDRPQTTIIRELEPGDPSSLVDVARAMITHAWELDPQPEPMPDDSGGDSEGSEPPSGAETELRFPWLDAGDLDGDGADDVLAQSVGFDDSLIEARSGADGSLLWRAEVPADLYWAVPDMDGDGTDDLFALSYELHELDQAQTCDDTACTGRLDASYTYGLTARAGADGGQLWSRTVPGEWHERWRDEQTEYGWHDEYELEVTDLGTYPYPAGDHDGDGGRDVVLNRIEVELRYVDARSDELVGQREGEYELRGATTASLVGGAGAELYTDHVEAPGIPLLGSGGDLTGDVTPDLVWVTEVAESDTWTCIDANLLEVCQDEEEVAASVRLEVIDGQTAEPAWSWEQPDAQWPWVFVTDRDLDGDGTGDLLVDLAGPDGFVTHLVSAGESRWTYSGLGVPTSILPLGGEATDDIVFEAIVIRIPLGPCPQATTTCSPTMSLRVHRVDGATGALLADTSVTRELDDEENGVWIALFRSFDLDGDGHTDPSLVGGTIRLDAGDDPGEGEHLRSFGVVQSAASGQNLVDRTDEGYRSLDSLGDLDGDGLGDLVDLTRDGESLATLTATSLASGDQLWVLSPDDPWPWLAGDQDGAPGVELTWVDGGQLESVRGRDLAPRWTAPLP